MQTLHVRLVGGTAISLSLNPQTTVANVATALEVQLDPIPPPLHEVRLLRVGEAAELRGGDSVAELGLAPGEELQAVVGLSVGKVSKAFETATNYAQEQMMRPGFGRNDYRSAAWQALPAAMKALARLSEMDCRGSGICQVLADFLWLCGEHLSEVDFDNIVEFLRMKGDTPSLAHLHDLHWSLLYNCPSRAPKVRSVIEHIEQRDVTQPGGLGPAELDTAVGGPVAPAVEGTGQPEVDEVSTEEDVAAALRREGADVQEAILRSKADPRSPDGVLVTRLTFHTPEVAAQILGHDAVATCVERVADAGCDVQPPWAGGAILLVPLTEPQLREAGVSLKAHNIVVLEVDRGRVEEALGSLPRRRRPMLKPECHGQDADAGALGASDPESGQPVQFDVSDLVVEHTFYTLPEAKDVSEVSSSKVVHSEPGQGAASSPHPNPRRWA